MTEIGRYRVTRLLARTGLSEVYAGSTPSGEPVCVKRLLPALAVPGSEVVLSFRREAALLAEVRHPNVVRVLEVGEDGGVPFTCLELVEGHSLEEEIRQGPAPLARGLQLLVQVANGLSRVHARGIVHGDLKPANILLKVGEAGPEVKLADFGLAAEAAGAASGLSGTPHYMAPEQTRLVDWPVDARTDLYALGVIAFELFTGRLPFDATDPAALLAAQVSSPPPRPRQLRGELPPLLESILLKLLEKNPAQRYRSADSLAQDLSELGARLKRNEASPAFVLDGTVNVSEQLGQVFVGRQREVAELEAALERARQGRPGAVLVGGLAGVGKSALLKEFLNHSMTGGARFALGKCYEFARSLPYYVLAEALTDYLRRLKRWPQARQEAAIAELRASVGELGAELVKVAPAYAELFPEAPPSVYLGEGKDQARFLQMLVRVLEAAARGGGPLVLLLDDLQWADSGTLRVLETVVDTLKEAAVLLVGTYRSEEVPADHPLQKLLSRAGQQQGLVRVEVRPFDKPQTALLAAESLRQPVSALPEPVVDLLYERTEGNPLFVTEVLKALLASGALGVSAGLLSVSSERLQATHFPGSVVEIVLRRVEGLSPEVRTILGAAALVGKGFTLPLLAHASGVPAEVAYAGLQQGLEQKLLQPPRDGVYRFHHDRVQEACSRLVAEGERPGVHRRIVQHLEETRPGLLTEDAVFECAEHAFRAGDAERIWRYGRAAGERAQGRYANEQALNHYRRALEAAREAGAPDAEQLPVRARMAEALDLLGRYQESVGDYTRILEQPLPTEERARYLGRLGHSLQKAGQPEKARERLLEAMAELGEPLRERGPRLGAWLALLAYGVARLRVALGGARPGDVRTQLRVEILTRLWTLSSIGSAHRLPALAWRLLADAIHLGPSKELAAAHRILAITLVQLPRPPWGRALEHGIASVGVGRQVGAHLDAAIGSLYTSDIFCWSARYRESLPWLQTAREGLTALGNMWELANVHIFSYLAQRGLGRLDEALAHAHALVELGERLQAPNTLSNGSQKVADILLMRGDTARGESFLARSLSLAEERKLNFERFQGYKIQGAARLREGRYAEARAHYGAALKLLESHRFFQAYLGDTYFGYAEAFLKDADHFAASGGLKGEEGRRVTQQVRQWLGRERLLLGHLGYGHRVRALLLWRQGKLAASRRAFEHALEVLRHQERPLDVALTELEAAETLSGHEPGAALEWARRARAAFEEQRLGPLLERVERVLTRLGHPTQVARPAEDKSTRALSELVRLGPLLMQSHEPEAVLERIVEASVSLLGAERGFLFTRPRPDAPLRMAVGRTADGRRLVEEEAQVSQGVIDQVEQRGEGLAVSDTQEEELLRERRSIMAFQLRSVLCAPLTHAGKRLGVLYLDCQVTRAIFGPTELELLTSFAAQAAIALSNALHVSQIEEMNRELDAKVLERTRQLETMNLQLTASMNELQNTTLRLAEAKHEALEKELEVARGIQLAMVPPQELFELPAARISGLLQPASFCGGDFWLYLEQGERVILFIGDVTGHGVGSAMITTTAKSCVDTLWLETGGKLSLDALMATTNDVICGMAKGKMMMSAFAVEVDRASRKLTYCVAGHPPQYLVKNSGEKVELAPLFGRGPLVGDRRGNSYPLTSTPYAPGDRIVLYTDGVVECVDASDKLYGDRRFRKLLQQHGREGVETLLTTVREDVQRFAAGAPQADDITLVVAELR